MEFEDERSSVGRNRQSTSLSRRSGGSMPVLIKGSRAQRSSLDDFSLESSVVVRGAGANSWEVQDAGNLQMVQDDCTYLCGTILTAKTPSQALESALDLAKLLATKKTRSVLWQSLEAETTTHEMHPSEASIATVSSGNSNASPEQKTTSSGGVLEAILDVIAGCGARPRGRRMPGTNSSQNSSGNSVKTMGRTKSARRKLKQQQAVMQQKQQDTRGGASQGLSNAAVMSQELRQVLAVIVYYLSWDCTTSKEHSIVGIGSGRRKALARKVRLTILKHGKALQGMLRLCLAEQETKTGSSASVDSQSIDLSIPTSSGSQPLQVQVARKRRRQMNTSSGSSVVSSTSSLSSVSYQDHVGSSGQRGGGDPTKSGRRKRRQRRQQLTPVAEDSMPDSLDWPESQVIPPLKRAKVGNDQSLSFTSDENASFAIPSAPAHRLEDSQGASPASSPASKQTARSNGNSRFSNTLGEICGKVSYKLSNSLDSDQKSSTPLSCQENTPLWITTICIQSLNRIISGKEGEEPSILEPDEDDEEGDDEEEDLDESSNPIFVTNMLLGKSGALPLLSKCLSHTLASIRENLVQPLQRQESSNEFDAKFVSIWHDHISNLASLIDGACLFHDNNRRAFAEHDPLSFDTKNNHDGVIYQILAFLHCMYEMDGKEMQVGSFSHVLSDIQLTALRTLTSLTHDNAVAAELLTECHNFGGSVADGGMDFGIDKETDEDIHGIGILAKLAFQLETGPSSMATEDGESHRYDSTIFCLNTLANVLEARNARRMLAEVKVELRRGKLDLWLKWLCQWLVQQTETFQEAILSLGKTDGESKRNQRELEKSEEDKLVAAGNGCVVLACLMVEPEEVSEEPESTNTIRNLILEQMPLDKSGNSTGATVIINTLKAFCNFYHFSLGELSMAIVTPVKKLIDELEALQAEES